MVVPDERGAIGGSLKIEWPANMQPLLTTQNPLITACQGSVESGSSFDLAECQYSPFWAFRITLVITDPSTGFIYLRECPGVGLTVMSCEPGYPAYPASGAGVWFGLNGTWATEETSWGAIKSL